MRNLTRRGFLTGAAVLALKPLTVPLTPYAEGFTVADLTNAVDALRAAEVPALGGYYQLFIPPGIRHLFDLPLEERIAAGWELGPVGGGNRCEHCDGPHYGAECPVTYPTGQSWSDPMESALASQEGRS